MPRKHKPTEPVLEPGAWHRGVSLTEEQAKAIEVRRRRCEANSEELLALFWHQNP